MSVGAIIALVGAIAGFVGIGLYVAIKGRDLRWPENGQRYETQRGKYKVTLILSEGSPDIAVTRVAEQCALASKSVVEAWGQVFPDEVEEVSEGMEHVAVWLLSDSEFDELDDWYKKINGTVGNVSRMLGAGIPMVIARVKFVPDVLKHGGIVVHEMVHIANRDSGADGNIWSDVGHDDPKVWMHGGDESVEARARKLVEAQNA